MSSIKEKKDNEVQAKSRRNATKTIAAVGVVGWHAPILKTVVSPAHATMSAEPTVDQVVMGQPASANVNILIAPVPVVDS